MRAKPLVLTGTAGAGAVALLSGSQTWISFMVEGAHVGEAATGFDVNAALSPIAIALIAAALALTIAGPVFRRVLGVLVLLLGAGIVALSVLVLLDPLGSVSARITELTGIMGEAAASAVTWSDVTAWGVVSVIAGILAAVCGMLALVTARSWRGAGRKYDAQRSSTSAGEGDDADHTPDRISDWDALSDGDDPTSAGRE